MKMDIKRKILYCFCALGFLFIFSCLNFSPISPNIKPGFIPDPKPKDGSIWFPYGLKTIIHEKHGLAGRKQLKMDVIINHAKFHGYDVDTYHRLIDGRQEYNISTSWDPTLSHLWDADFVVNPNGTVYSITGEHTVYYLFDYQANIMKFYNYLCKYLRCKKVDIGRRITVSEFVNSGPFDVKFPRGKEKSIRFRLGLADAKSIRIEAVRSHAEALGYKVLDTDKGKVKNERKTVNINTGLSLSGEFRQNYVIQVGKNGWIYSINEYRLKR